MTEKKKARRAEDYPLGELAPGEEKELAALMLDSSNRSKKKLDALEASGAFDATEKSPQELDIILKQYGLDGPVEKEQTFSDYFSPRGDPYKYEHDMLEEKKGKSRRNEGFTYDGLSIAENLKYLILQMKMEYDMMVDQKKRENDPRNAKDRSAKAAADMAKRRAAQKAKSNAF